MRIIRFLLWMTPFLGSSLIASPLRGGEQVQATAIELIKSADSRNMEDFDELQKAITRVLEREGEDIFAILDKSRESLLSKIKADIHEIMGHALESYEDKNSSEYNELDHLLSVLWDAKDLLRSRTSLNNSMIRNFFSDRYILSIMKEHGREVIAAKVALIYILQEISREHVMNLRALKMSRALVIHNSKAKEALKKTALYDHEENVLYVPNSGYSVTGEPSLTDFRGTNAEGFAELCVFGKNTVENFKVKHFINLWKIEKKELEINSGGLDGIQILFLMAKLGAREHPQSPEDLQAGDLIVTKEDVMVVEESPKSLQSIPVIHNTRGDRGWSPDEKEGIVAVKIPLPSKNVWVLRPRG